MSTRLPANKRRRAGGEEEAASERVALVYAPHGGEARVSDGGGGGEGDFDSNANSGARVDASATEIRGVYEKEEKDDATESSMSSESTSDPRTALSIRRPRAGPPPAGLTHMNSAVEFSGSSFDADYEVGEVLGHGTFSIVRRCVHRATGVMRAVKIIDTTKFRLAHAYKSAGQTGLPRSLGSQILDEVRILRALAPHPHILSLLDLYDQPWGPERHECILLVTELAPGGELFDSIIKAGNFTEPQAKFVMWQALGALDYMHNRGVIHRDLKPENLLVFKTFSVPSGDPVVRPGVEYPACVGGRPPAACTPMLQVKLADFGVARYVGSAAASGANTFVGSPQYVAPEVLFARESGGSSSYGRPVDVYSMGVILYVCLAGYLPFDDHAPRPPDALQPRDADTWEDRVKAGRYYFAPPVWTHISETAKDLIRNMMHLDPLRRFTVQQALCHPWFTSLREAYVHAADAGPGFDHHLLTLPDMSRLHLTSPTASRGSLPATTTALTPFTTSGVFTTTAATVPPTTALMSGQQAHIIAPGAPGYGFGYAPWHAPAVGSGTTAAAVGAPQARQGLPPSHTPVPLPLASGTAPVAVAGLSSGGHSGATGGKSAVRPPFAGAGDAAAVAAADFTLATPRDYQLQVLQTVARSLDFELLLQLQRSTAETFRAAYSAVSDVPQAAIVIRRHAVACRDLQLHSVRKVVLRCRSIAQSILGLLPDLMESIVESDTGLTQGCFERMREWVSELKTESHSMRTSYSSVIAEVQLSLEQARILRMDEHVHDFTSRAALPDVPAGEREGGTFEKVKATHSSFVEPTRTPGATLLRAPFPSTPTPPSTPTHTLGGGGGGGGMWMPSTPPLQSTAQSPAGSEASNGINLPPSSLPSNHSSRMRPEHAAALTEAVLSHNLPPTPAGTAASGRDGIDDMMELFLDTPHMLSNAPRFHRVLSDLGVQPPVTARLAASAGGGSKGTEGDIPMGEGHASTSGDPRGAFHGVGSADTPSSTSIPGAAPTSSYGSEGSHHDDGHSHSSHKCLGCALAELRRVDVILTEAIDFWTSMELVTDVVARRKEHSETLLKFSSSSRMIAKATASLKDYAVFWQAFAFLCGTYSDALAVHTKEMYAWLLAPELVDAEYSDATRRHPLANVSGGSGMHADIPGSGSLDSLLAARDTGGFSRASAPSSRALDDFLAPTPVSSPRTAALNLDLQAYTGGATGASGMLHPGMLVGAQTPLTQAFRRS